MGEVFPVSLSYFARAASAALDRGCRGEQVVRHLLGCRVDHLAVERGSALALSFGFLEGDEDALGALHFLRGRRVDLVGELDLRRMDRPLAFHAESGAAASSGLVAFRIVDAAERAVDRTQAERAAGDRHARQREVPLVARIVGVEAADDDRAGLVEGRVVGNAEVHRLEAAVGRSDGFDVGHAERRLDEGFHADLVRQALGDLDLADDSFRWCRRRPERRPSGSGSCRAWRRPARTMSTTSR